MPVPEFEEIKAPALQFFRDGMPHRIAEVYEALARHFSLTEADLAEVLPSGRQRRWHNRAGWSCYDLFRAGLLERPKRGVYQITEIGRKIAEQEPKIIDRDFLARFPQFQQWIEATEARKPAKPEDAVAPANRSAAEADRTPEEMIDSAHRLLRNALKKEVLELVRRMDPIRFEQLVLDLLLAMGYGGSREEAARVTKASHDEGIDGIINEDRLGLDVIYLQAKRWAQTVGRKEIQSFVGALAGQRAHKGVFITTSDFADTALTYAKTVAQKVILIDGDRLADLMIQHNIGVSLSHAYEVKQVDSDYFELD